MDQPNILIGVTLLLCTLIFIRAIILRKRAASQEILLSRQAKLLKKLKQRCNEEHEIQEREEMFHNNLQQAEVTTELQQTRSSFMNQHHSQRAPERYGYAKSMAQSGMNTDEISLALGMSNTEITQLLKLSSLCRQDKQTENDTTVLFAA